MHGRILVYSNADEPLFELSPDEVFDCSRTEELNGKHTLTITTTHVLDYGYRVLMRDDTGKWREHVVTSIDERHSNGLRALGTYGCIWSIQYDLSGVICDTMPGTRTQGGVPAATALQSLLSNTSRWGVGTVTVATSAGASFYGLQAWEALGVFCKTWGGEIDADITVDSSGVVSRNVQALSHVGSSEVVRRFDYGNDITEIGRRVSSAMYYARIIPLGKGEQIRDASGNPTGGYGRRITIESVNNNIKYLENSETAQILRTPDGSGGWEYPTRTVINDSITTPDALLAWGNSVLEQYTVPQVTYIANVVQLARAGMDVHGVELGDNCVCVDRKFSDEGLRISGRISRLVVNELAPSLETDVTIGDVGITMADAFKTLGNKITGVEDNLNATAATTADYLEHLLDNLNSEINATGGYTYITAGQGIRTYDREVTDPLVGAEATQVTEIKGGTIRFANSKTAQGEWEWKTVIVSGHIAAEMVTAANLTTGYIGSSSGGNYWNLDTGELRMASTAQFGNTTVAGALADITAATNAANDDNLIPYTSNIDATHGWVSSNATFDGSSVVVLPQYTGEVNYSHYFATAKIPLSLIWGMASTLSFLAKSTASSTSIRIELHLFHAGESTHYAWTNIGTQTVGTSNSRVKKTFTAGTSLTWSYYTGSDENSFDPTTDVATFRVYLRTLSATLTVDEIKLQRGSTATAWSAALADSSSTAVLNTLTQADVFNRLTNNGQVQGIYLQNGKLYINASYIKTGTLSADLVRTGKLLSANGQSYFDLTNNTIRLGTSSTVGTTIESSGQIKAADANGSYFGTVAAGNAGSGVVGQMIYLAHGNYIFGALRAIPAGTSGTNYCGVELYTLKYSKRVTVSAFYALTAAQKVALFNTDANVGSSFGLSSESISAGSTEGNWSFLVNKNGVYFKGTPIS